MKCTEIETKHESLPLKASSIQPSVNYATAAAIFEKEIDKQIAAQKKPALRKVASCYKLSFPTP